MRFAAAVFARLALPLLLAAALPGPAAAADAACRTLLRDRMALAVGLYRIEISASHLVGQTARARGDAERRSQLARAQDGLAELKTRLESHATRLGSEADRATCAAEKAPVAALDAALGVYVKTVDARWRFMQARLEQLQRLEEKAPLPGDPREADLWLQEPLARYDIWRALAQAVTPGGEAAGALYVIGMLTRFEWDTALALRSAVRGGGNPRAALAAAAEDAAALRRLWPRPGSIAQEELWKALTGIAAALPDPRTAPVPQVEPPEGWITWTGAWITPYGTAFTHAVPGVLKGLEDLSLE
ncbi:hypothetical protein [Oleispirillum naphthae]|uniref:hypothetical protein n=1 Tax=Oleispirillum naphthae TaxID=2838853 RepID=UPI00308234B5